MKLNLETAATLYVLIGATLWGVMGLFGSELSTVAGSFAKILQGSIALAGAYAVYKYYQANK